MENEEILRLKQQIEQLNKSISNYINETEKLSITVKSLKKRVAYWLKECVEANKNMSNKIFEDILNLPSYHDHDGYDYINYINKSDIEKLAKKYGVKNEKQTNR